MWTRFMDMHSGGGCKEPPYEYIYIEAPESEARVIFYNRFGHNPERVTCTCCGSDYSISQEDTLEQATAFERGCRWVYKNAAGQEVPDGEAWKPGKGLTPGYWQGYVEERRPESYASPYRTLAEYLAEPDVLVIRANEIKPEERTGDVPEQGYVWQD